jgi:short-subunit dehydrogenase
MALKGKRILLTGASSGVGEAAALQLARAGASLALSARRVQRLDALAARIHEATGVRPQILSADLGRRGEAARLAREALRALGGIDVLINNAGTTTQGLTWAAGDGEDPRAMFETNVWSPLALAAELAPAMLARGDGTIVNVTSMVRMAPFPHLGHYAGSRAAVSAISDVMALELPPRGIRIVEVNFGAIRTAAAHEVAQIAGIEPWFKGGPGMGSAEKAAQVLVKAADAERSGALFYPAALKWVFRFPALGRRFSRRVSKHADLNDTTQRAGGSGGDARSRALRDNWESRHPAGAAQGMAAK